MSRTACKLKDCKGGERSAEQLQALQAMAHLFDLGERSENDEQQRREDNEALAQLVRARSHPESAELCSLVPWKATGSAAAVVRRSAQLMLDDEDVQRRA